jgi:hypothetical protein
MHHTLGKRSNPMDACMAKFHLLSPRCVSGRLTRVPLFRDGSSLRRIRWELTRPGRAMSTSRPFSCIVAGQHR